MRGSHRIVAGAAVTVLLLTACGGEKPAAKDRSKAVSFEATELASGESRSLTKLRGSPVLLASWATWCAPCRVELPKLQKLHEGWDDKGLEVVAVNVDSAGVDQGKIDAMVEEFGLTMALWRDSDGAFGTAFGPFGVPMTVLIGRDGRLVKRWLGILRTSDPEFLETLETALAA